MHLKIHLVFPGNCEEAFGVYKEVLGGEVVFLFRKKEDKTQVVSEEDKEKISHMILKTNHFDLAGEDADMSNKVIAGNNNKLVLVFHDLDECRRIFDSFSHGGNITMPFEKTFFCDGMGELTDRFGIPWIIMMTDEGYSA